LERLVRPVEITTFAGDDAKSRDMLALIADIRGLSEKITVTEAKMRRGCRLFALSSPGQDISLTLRACRWGMSSPRCAGLLQTAVIRQSRTGDPGSDPGAEGRFRFEPILAFVFRTAPMWCRR
ncbi:hypothetical protein, partial [Gemmobacter sp. 24YEA27]|uniref:hypothetical protein n=1 Tax=Gemmobacter sp. 24YEA27 TaxID=3040672 RepID=UPI0024B3C706